MKRVFFVACILGVFPFGSVHAQKWSEKELEVWKTVQDQWNANNKKDYDRSEQFLHKSHLGWEDKDPMPLDKGSISRWSRYLGEDVEVKQLQLSPVGFVVVGDTAVAHYYYSIATETKKGERKTIHGRYTDVLLKTGDGWRFIAWRGGDDPRWKEEG